ncbi:MAG: sulfatase [Halohasta sp.]
MSPTTRDSASSNRTDTPSSSREDTAPNIVLVTVDSLRADHCGFLGSEHELTPTLDRLAHEGLSFETAIAPGPRTPSSMPVIWTGEHVGHDNRGVYDSRAEKADSWRGRQRRIRRHTRRFETIAERLASRGYDTGAVTTNPWTSAETGFDQGFRKFEAINGLPDDGSVSLLKRLLAQGSNIPQVPDTERWLLTWPDIYGTVRAVHDGLSEPYFLWVFLLDPHQPYVAPAAYRTESLGPEMYYANVRYTHGYSPFEPLPTHLERWLRAAYRDSVRSVDAFLDRLLAELTDDDPALVVHADHGEAFGEHGTRGHRPELYEENLRVPLVAHNVDHTGRLDEQVALRQLPGFLESVADGETDPERLRTDSALAVTEEAERIAVRTPEWKRIRSRADWNFAHETPIDELFHLRVDAAETRNEFGSCPAIADRLDRQLDRHLSALDERARIGAAARTIRATGTLRADRQH